MEQFYTILTTIGKAKLANAQATGTPVNFSEIAVGDGNGSYYNPVESQKVLTNEVWRGSLNTVYTESENPGYLYCEGVIPDTDGGFSIRECGIFDNEGNLIAVGKVPETYKPTLPEGSTSGLAIKMILQISNTEDVTLLIDPSSVIAMQSWVINNFLKQTDAAAQYAPINGNNNNKFAVKEDLTSEDNALPFKTLKSSNDQNIVKNGDFSLFKGNDMNSPLCWVKYGNGNIIFDEVQQAIKVIRGVSGQTVIYQILPKELRGKKISVSFKYKMNTAIGTYANIVLDDGTAIGPSAFVQPSEDWIVWTHTFTLLDSDVLRLLLYCPGGTDAVEGNEILIKDVCVVIGDIPKKFSKNPLDLLSENINFGPLMTKYVNEDLVYTVNSTMTSAEIQSIIDTIPKYIPSGKTITIKFLNGTYNLISGLIINGFYGSGILLLEAESYTTETNTNQTVILECNATSGAFDMISITNNTVIVSMMGIRLNRNYSNGSVISVTETKTARIFYCYLQGPNVIDLYTCLFCNNSRIYANRNYYDKAYYGVRSQNQGHILIEQGIVGPNGLKYGLYATFGAVIAKAAASITGSISNEFTQYGGQIW